LGYLIRSIGFISADEPCYEKSSVPIKDAGLFKKKEKTGFLKTVGLGFLPGA
jgi:hypothetical protein